jgi:hypothetical protein
LESIEERRDLRIRSIDALAGDRKEGQSDGPLFARTMMNHRTPSTDVPFRFAEGYSEENTLSGIILYV